MGLIGERSIVDIDEGNQLFGKDALERAEVKAARTTAAAGRAALLTRGRRRASSGRRSLTRSCLPIRRSAPPTGPSDVAAATRNWIRLGKIPSHRQGMLTNRTLNGFSAGVPDTGGARAVEDSVEHQPKVFDYG